MTKRTLGVSGKVLEMRSLAIVTGTVRFHGQVAFWTKESEIAIWNPKVHCINDISYGIR